MKTRILLTAFICFIFGGVFSQNLSVTCNHNPAEGYVIDFQLPYYFYNCGGDITIIFKNYQATSKSYKYKGKTYTSKELGSSFFNINNSDLLINNPSFTADLYLKGDMASSNFFIGNFYIKELSPTEAGCYGQTTYDVINLLKLKNSDYKDKMAYLFIKNLKATNVNSKSYAVEAEIKNLEKDNEYNIKIKEADALFLQNKYDDAIQAYKQASALKYNEEYPKTKIKQIEQILSDKDKKQQEVDLKKQEENQTKNNNSQDKSKTNTDQNKTQNNNYTETPKNVNNNTSLEKDILTKNKEDNEKYQKDMQEKQDREIKKLHEEEKRNDELTDKIASDMVDLFGNMNNEGESAKIGIFSLTYNGFKRSMFSINMTYLFRIWGVDFSLSQLSSELVINGVVQDKIIKYYGGGLNFHFIGGDYQETTFQGWVLGFGGKFFRSPYKITPPPTAMLDEPYNASTYMFYPYVGYYFGKKRLATGVFLDYIILNEVSKYISLRLLIGFNRPSTSF